MKKVITERKNSTLVNLSCLTSSHLILGRPTIHKFLKYDPRLESKTLHRLVDYNRKTFQFLGIDAAVVSAQNSYAVSLSTSRKIGCAPLLSPYDGSPIADINISPGYVTADTSNFMDILELFADNVYVGQEVTLPLVSSKGFKPPIFLEAVKFLHCLNTLGKHQWVKFSSVEKMMSVPNGLVNWNKYLSNDYKIEKRLVFPTRKNVVNEYHDEYSQLRYVFDLCKQILSESTVPKLVQANNSLIISALEQKLYFHKPSKVSNIQIRQSDLPIVKQCKHLANQILQLKSLEGVAWHVDIAEVFERFVQYLFMKATKIIGASFHSNPWFKSLSNMLDNWQLKGIEPDGYFTYNGFDFFIDAKYKSHLYNYNSSSEKLKEEHRNDLHQILAYTSFRNEKPPFGILCYPSPNVICRQVRYKNPFNQVSVNLYMFGFPFDKSKIEDCIRKIVETISIAVDTNRFHPPKDNLEALLEFT